MENLNFLSTKFHEIEIKQKIKRCKIIVFMLWCLCLILFIVFMYLNSFSKDSKSSTSKIYENNKEAKLIKKTDTIDNFIDFYKSPNYNEAFKELTVNENEIQLTAATENKELYYSTIYNLEHSNKYNIIYLSPVKDYNSKYSFKLTLEVKK